MNERMTLGRFARGWGLPIILAALVVYFGYFAVYGKHGVMVWLQNKNTIQLRLAQLETIKAERNALEHRVRLLRPESVDPDLLEEQARARLGFTRPDEVVILKSRQ